MTHRVGFSTTTKEDRPQGILKLLLARFWPNLLSQRVDAKVCQYTVEDRDAALEMGLCKVLAS